jgi:hypothetical protein
MDMMKPPFVVVWLGSYLNRNAFRNGANGGASIESVVQLLKIGAEQMRMKTKAEKCFKNDRYYLTLL